MEKDLVIVYYGNIIYAKEYLQTDSTEENANIILIHIQNLN